MWGDMSLWKVQGPLLHTGDHIVPRILTVDYTFKKHCNADHHNFISPTLYTQVNTLDNPVGFAFSDHPFSKAHSTV